MCGVRRIDVRVKIRDLKVIRREGEYNYIV